VGTEKKLWQLYHISKTKSNSPIKLKRQYAKNETYDKYNHIEYNGWNSSQFLRVEYKQYHLFMLKTLSNIIQFNQFNFSKLRHYK